jgi:hypothetical protein
MNEKELREFGKDLLQAYKDLAGKTDKDTGNSNTPSSQQLFFKPKSLREKTENSV